MARMAVMAAEAAKCAARGLSGIPQKKNVNPNDWLTCKLILIALDLFPKRSRLRLGTAGSFHASRFRKRREENASDPHLVCAFRKSRFSPEGNRRARTRLCRDRRFRGETGPAVVAAGCRRKARRRAVRDRKAPRGNRTPPAPPIFPPFAPGHVSLRQLTARRAAGGARVCARRLPVHSLPQS